MKKYEIIAFSVWAVISSLASNRVPGISGGLGNVVNNQGVVYWALTIGTAAFLFDRSGRGLRYFSISIVVFFLFSMRSSDVVSLYIISFCCVEIFLLLKLEERDIRPFDGRYSYPSGYQYIQNKDDSIIFLELSLWGERIKHLIVGKCFLTLMAVMAIGVFATDFFVILLVTTFQSMVLCMRISSRIKSETALQIEEAMNVIRVREFNPEYLSPPRLF